MRFVVGQSYEYRVPNGRWRTARCVQDEQTGVIRVRLSARRMLNPNRPEDFAAYEWRQKETTPVADAGAGES